MANVDGEKEVSEQALAQSVISPPEPPPEGAAPSIGGGLESVLIWFMAGAADEMVPWGGRPALRDAQLRAFIPKESYFLSALGTVVARNLGFSWQLSGLPKILAPMEEVFDNANQGKGWENLIARLSIDLYTQDKGAFMEVVRAGDSRSAALIGLNHLPAAQCWHTGDPKYPVVYQDRLKKYHRLAWYQVSSLLEMPAPIEKPPGLQYCALTRLMRAAQVIRNISIYKEEKTAGRHARALHLIQGVTANQIQDALEKMRVSADAEGRLRYVDPIIVPVTKADVNLDIKTMEMVSMPDGWDEEKYLKMYITIIAMAFLSDYQDFAPLPGGNLGTSTQSEILHLKSRGKGPAIFRKLISRTLNNQILPSAVRFSFEEQDLQAEEDMAKIGKIRAETRKFQVESGELSIDGARQQAVDIGDISTEVFEMMGQQDVTPGVVVTDVERLEQKEVMPAKAGPFRRGVGEGVPADEEEGEEGADSYWEEYMAEDQEGT